MYVVERLAGQIIYCLCLFIIFIKIYNGNYKSLKKTLNIYIVLLAIMGFLFVPSESSDLYSIIPIVKSYGNKSLSYIFTNSVIQSSTPLSVLYYYIFGKIGIMSLLPCITSIIVYNNIFYIIRDYSEKNKISNKAIALTLLFLMSSGFFIDVISNIRTLFAYSLLSRTVYDELHNGKKIIKSLPCYIAAILIHSSIVGILLLRFLYYFLFENNNKIYKKIFYCMLMAILYVFISKYIISSFAQFEHYVHKENGYFYIWEFIKIIIMIFGMSIILHRIKDKKTKYFNIIIIIFTIIIMCFGEFNIFLRFNYFNILIMIPLLLDYFNPLYLSGKKSIIFVISIIMLLISCTRGHLSSLKFFVINGG